MASPMVISKGGMCPADRRGRKAIFSMKKPRIQATPMPMTRATYQGRCSTLRAKYPMKAPIMYTSPWAKVTRFIVPKMMTNPMAIEGVNASLGQTVDELGE